MNIQIGTKAPLDLSVLFAIIGVIAASAGILIFSLNIFSAKQLLLSFLAGAAGILLTSLVIYLLNRPRKQEQEKYS